MLRNCACLVIAHMVDATQLCLSCNCTHGDNHRLEEYVWSFLFRMNVRPKLLEALGKLAQKANDATR